MSFLPGILDMQCDKKRGQFHELREPIFGSEHLLAPCPDGARRSDVGEPPVNIFPHLNYGRGKECRSKSQISETGTNYSPDQIFTMKPLCAFHIPDSLRKGCL